jgi:hypothetical protein
MKLSMIAAILVVAGSAQAQSLTEKYELSERCGKQAEERYAKEVESRVLVKVDYENHYNSRLNKCFYLSINDGPGLARMLTLSDLNERKAVAIYYHRGDDVEHCSVQQQQCTSEAEWRELIKPFMEE